MKIKANEFPDKNNPVTIFNMKATYLQEDDEKEDLQELKISAENQGGDYYFVLETNKWAINDIDKLTHVLNDFKERLFLNDK